MMASTKYHWLTLLLTVGLSLTV